MFDATQVTITSMGQSEVEAAALEGLLGQIGERRVRSRDAAAAVAAAAARAAEQAMQGATTREDGSERVSQKVVDAAVAHEMVRLGEFAGGEAEGRLEVVARTDIGRKKQNEDMYSVMDHFDELQRCECGGAQYVGLFDGHGGAQAAQFSRRHLPWHLASRLRASGDVSNAAVERGMFDAFKATDRAFLSVADELSINSGTTATCMLIWPRQRLVVANCGDNRAVLYDGREASLLFTPHSLSEESERARVVAAGAKVVWFGTWRVNGVLAVTRSIGDRSSRDVVISDPDTISMDLSHLSSAENPFIILATDGLWDVVDNDTAVSIVNRAISNHEHRSAASLLVDCALENKSSDNITVIVIFL